MIINWGSEYGKCHICGNKTTFKGVKENKYICKDCLNKKLKENYDKPT